MKPDVSSESAWVFEKQLSYWGLSIGDNELESLRLYVSALATYERANVVGTRDADRLWLGQILDLLSCLLCGPLRCATSLADIGSGGGMLGIPLHLAGRLDETCLVESTGKKADFLKQVAGHLGLGGLRVANCRAEDLSRKPGHREAFEAATVRAVAPLSVISDYCLPFLAPGGHMIAMKGRVDGDELESGKRASEALGGVLEDVLQVPFIREIE